MHIELDDATVARLRKKAEEDALKLLTTEIMKQFNMKQIASEVRNIAIKQATDLIANKINSEYKSSEIIERSLGRAEEIVRKQITDKLSAGVTVRFNV